MSAESDRLEAEYGPNLVRVPLIEMPGDMSVEMDLLGVDLDSFQYRQNQYPSGSITHILLSRRCQYDREYHFNTKCCGCYVWLSTESRWSLY